MTRTRARLTAGLVGLVLACAVPVHVAAQGNAGQTLVSYDVEISVGGSQLDRNCTATGTDVLTGTLVGREPDDPEEDREYVGTLTRTTRITTCGARRLASGEDVTCSMSFTGNGFADVVLTVYADQRGGWLQYVKDRAQWAALLPPPRAGPQNSVVNGTCDPVEMAQLQAEYPGGQTAGSPSGQPLEVTGLPPSAYPSTFAADPPNSIWTLKVLARRP